MFKEFNQLRQKRQQIQERPQSSTMHDIPALPRSRTDSVGSSLSTSSSISSTSTGNALSLSPIMVLAEIHYDPLESKESRTDSDIVMWRCPKHKTTSPGNVHGSVPSVREFAAKADRCSCYDWTKERGRELVDGI